jgi:hypothetical protein
VQKAIAILLVVAALGLAGCNDTTAPRDVTPPAAPRGLFSVTGDGQVALAWFANTEGDVTGYRLYQSPCNSGPDCPYDRVGSTSGTQFVLPGLVNGVTRFYAISAVDQAGNESALSHEDVFDTPRPAGSGTLNNFVNRLAGAAWDFSAFSAKSASDATADMFFGYDGRVYQMFTPDSLTDIQDAGYATSLDAVDFAPEGGWSPSGSVELIPGHCYVVWTRDNNFAKFRVTGLAPTLVSFNWGYQTARGNPELRARPARAESAALRPVTWLRP